MTFVPRVQLTLQKEAGVSARLPIFPSGYLLVEGIPHSAFMSRDLSGWEKYLKVL